ncbi:hypothetical protein V6N11_070968 [Hibiscus sabdariffa]|uniref:Uncharacterized protein n=2 Tax=Hibiscus sabdariffa TaxID=183260 RepID=A0ABR1ZD92_9ROSI
MDSPSLSPESGLSSSTAASNDAIPRVKFLCSFLGGILPRPQDGKLRYVGGETHIVSVPRDISYAKLMTKMRELYDGAAVLKYQQPGEDLDALVSVTNDDDVINMMEEFEKLGSRDRFTRLRIFLFLHPDQDGLSQYVYGNERETERRFVDDLKILNVGFDFRKYDSPVPSQVSGDSHLAEQFLDRMSIDGGVHNRRSAEIPIPLCNLHTPTIPQFGSGQFLRDTMKWKVHGVLCSILLVTMDTILPEHHLSFHLHHLLITGYIFLNFKTNAWIECKKNMYGSD